jgi:hypothetical protein
MSWHVGVNALDMEELLGMSGGADSAAALQLPASKPAGAAAARLTARRCALATSGAGWLGTAGHLLPATVAAGSVAAARAPPTERW